MRFFVLLFVLASAACCFASHVDSSRLHSKVLESYDKEVIPDHANVTFGLNIHCGRYCTHTKRFFTSVWERYTWFDSRLTFNPEDYGGVKVLRVCPDEIWTPDFRLYFPSSPKTERGHVRAVVKPDGEVTWIVPALYETFCDIDGDKAHCDYNIGSWVYSDSDLDLTTHQLGVGTEFYDSHCPYTASVVSSELQKKKYPCCEDTYSHLHVTVDYTKSH